ncbi:hypothetical protein COV49_03155 [Candidatus Falkowbacteria bacterium CG11_big_fil_rev_8_21_14_0_20_39_10]|uniref:Tellurite resistance methyltransferase TehB-like domain-containing protein n=1 Tax=Candidatus Falkowbacteria bacterium CG11_big_fil_rev_8_21_14_0_20_39_10 TaxID=1974570 RepID=A0A2M6K8R6_9BACT|nr:MAG: hypothetical protein COV49_03155 [Candidatus Falkowbacteria bacterium CG11_big_fil_rev_8_21_14_0_20_39_10]
MKLKKEAFGLASLGYYKGEKTYEIIERDDGCVEVSVGFKNYFSEYKDWPEHEKKALKYAKGRILDIGCGVGRHSLYLQKKGFDVAGTDRSFLAIKVCRLRGLKKARALPIEEIDKLKPNIYDTILMLGNNFGLFGGFNKAKVLLKKLSQITSAKAVIIAESTDPHKTKDKNHLDYHKLNKKRGRMAGQLKIRVRFKKYKSDWFDYLLASEKEMREILEGTGWKIQKIIKSKRPQYIAIIKKTK